MKTPIMPEHAPKTHMLCGSSYEENVRQYGTPPKGWRWRKVGEKCKAGDLFVFPSRFMSICATTAAYEDYWPVITPVESSAVLEYEVLYEDQTFTLIKITSFASNPVYFKASNGKFIEESSVSEYHRNMTEGLFVGTYGGLDRTVCIPTERWPDIKVAIEEFNLKFSTLPKPKKPKTVTFNYGGGTYSGFRTVKVEEETPEVLKGIDLADNQFKSYRKDKIVGKILTVKA